MANDMISRPVREFLNSLVPARGSEMAAMEAYAAEHDFPIIGPACGHLCYQIARMTGATRVFEMGSGFGYSTAWFAKAVKENGGGVVHHVVWDDDLSGQARVHLDALGLGDVVEYHVAEAVQTLRETTDGPFDLIFCDIEKEDYPAALKVIAEQLVPGGVLIVDNILWHGQIFDDDDHSAATEGVRTLTRALTEDESWISTVIPIRDGLMVAWRRPD